MKEATDERKDATVELKITLDGSTTLYAPDFGQHYHSVHGAIQESMHVFIEAGLAYSLTKNKQINLLEVGYGTGLNAFLSYLHRQNSIIHYTGIDAYPVPANLAMALNYPDQINAHGGAEIFKKMSNFPWNQRLILSPEFSFRKVLCMLEEFQCEDRFDLIFFDAFSPNSQPELWTVDIFARLYAHCNPGAIMTTYSAKGSIRRAMQAAGFSVEKLPGPPGKREMVRASRPS